MEGGVRMAMEMLLVQAIATGLQLLSKVILGQGAFVFALMTYRHIVAAFCVAPFAFFLERHFALKTINCPWHRMARGVYMADSVKKLSFSAVICIFFVALSGITMAMGFFFYGLQNTSATYATNFLNLIPIVTFIFSIITRVEKLRLKTKAGNIILIGIMSCLAGALTVTLYKGKTFHLSTLNINNQAIAPTVKPNWGLGTIFLVCSCISYGFWFIIQAKLFKIFPYKYSSTTLTCIFATFQSIVVGLFIDRTKASWKLGWNLQLVTILYSGALATAATFCLISSAVAQRGPTYPSIFNPLSLILVAIAESALLGSSISVGSLIGMTLIILGLYLFLWGKNMEIKTLILSTMRKTEAQVTAVGTSSMQSTAVVVPTSSPNERHIYIDCAEEDEDMTKPR